MRGRSSFTWLIVALVGVLVSTVPARGAVTATPIGTFSYPMLVTAPAGDPHRIFVVEGPGAVHLIQDGVRAPEPFLDVSARIDPLGTGLTSMAFAPDYDRTGRVYVLYDAPPAGHAPGSGAGVDVLLEEYTREPGGAKVDPASRRVVLRLDFTGSQDHRADHLAFGPDGLLYLTIGDGLTGFDLAQDRDAPRGKLLRLDPRDDSPVPEVLAYGLRNPWRFSLDAERRTVAIADVGDKSKEEVSLLSIDRGTPANLGWPCWEGTSPHNVCTAPGHQPPRFEYGHDEGACSIIGGPTVGPGGPASLRGRYVHGDFCTGLVQSANLRSSGALDHQPVLQLPTFGLSGFGEDGCGRLYALHQNTGLAGGNVWRLDESPAGRCGGSPAPSTGSADREEDAEQPGPDPGAGGSSASTGGAPPRATSAPRDRSGPMLRLSGRLGLGARRGTLTGIVSDASGVRSLAVAVRAHRRGQARCRWWVRGLRRLGRRSEPCARPRWMRATLVRAGTGVRWRVDLGRGLPRGRYDLLVRAVDGAGNLTRRLDRRSRVPFRVG